jgi:hypothetical protein
MLFQAVNMAQPLTVTTVMARNDRTYFMVALLNS